MEVTLGRAIGPALAVIAAGLLGFACGFSPGAAQLLIVALIAIAAAAMMMQSPAWALSAFWVGYCLQSTLLADSLSYSGLFYPLYLIMIVNAVLFLFAGRVNPFRTRPLSQFFLLLAAYVGLTLLALSHGSPGEDYPFSTYQRAFIHMMAIIATLEFWLDPNRRRFLTVQSLVSAVVCGWVIWRAQESGFGYRAATGVNENYLAEIIGVGLLPAVARMISGVRRTFLSQLPSTLLLGAGVYSMLLLASRGVFLAFLAAVSLAFFHRVRRISTVLGTVAVLAAMAFALSQLPGADGLRRRFNGEDLDTLNDRTQIWNVVLHATADGSLQELALGHGFDSTANVVRNHFSEYTSTHNAYIQVLYEFGAIGLIAFLSCHLYPLFRLARRRDWIATASGSMLIFFMGCALTDTASDKFQYWLVLAFAAATACAAAPPVSAPIRATFYPAVAHEAAS